MQRTFGEFKSAFLFTMLQHACVVKLASNTGTNICRHIVFASDTNVVSNICQHSCQCWNQYWFQILGRLVRHRLYESMLLLEDTYVSPVPGGVHSY